MSDITAPLSNTVIKKVTHLCDKGDAAFDAHEFVQAIEHYKAALHALPEPFIEYEISTFLTAGIGDAYFYLGKYEDALSFFDIALVTPDGLEIGRASCRERV